MASSNQADTSHGAKKAKPKKLSQKEQSERFKETARELGIDDGSEAFDRAFKTLVPPAKP